jgi:cytochrome c peroxidase
VALGRTLFFDPRLSGSGAISCATCHNPSLGWEDGLKRGIGHRGAELGRHTPTIIDVAWAEPLFWDGRAATLEEQAKGPIKSASEMNMPHDEAVKRVASISGYRAAFERAYPGEGVNIDTIAKAIASYERTIVSAKAPFDRWAEGDSQAISDSAKRGFVLFNGKAGCATCHSGWRFTDDGFHDIGLPSQDLGRAAIAPGIKVLEHAFKTPTLRNVDQRAPYMHDGSVATLEAVVDHYDHGFVARESLAPEMKPLKLTADEKADLIAFMRSLTSHDKPVELPTLPTD